MSTPQLGGLPLARGTYAIVVAATGLVWSALYVVALWEGLSSVFSRSRAQASTPGDRRPRRRDHSHARRTIRRPLEDRSGAWEDDGGRVLDEVTIRSLRSRGDTEVRHAAFR